MLEGVEDGLHEAVGQTLQLIVPEFEPLQRMQILERLVRDCVDTRTNQTCKQCLTMFRMENTILVESRSRCLLQVLHSPFRTGRAHVSSPAVFMSHLLIVLQPQVLDVLSKPLECVGL